MRVLAMLMLGSLVAVASGWTRGTLPAPPRCTTADSRARGDAEVPTPGLPGGHPLYVRACGPARAVVELHGRAPVAIGGGHCIRDADGGFLVGIGMFANAPAAPAASLGLYLHRRVTHAGTFRLAETAAGTVYARIQLRDRRDLDIAGGTITVGRSMRAGAFALRLRNATRVTGSWSCG